MINRKLIYKSLMQREESSVGSKGTAQCENASKAHWHHHLLFSKHMLLARTSYFIYPLAWSTSVWAPYL